MTAPLKIKDLQALLAAGGRVAVEFTQGIVDCEDYAEPGMRAYALSYSLNEPDVCRVVFDYEAFSAHNAALEQATYYDGQGIPRLTAREAGQYQPQADLWLTPEDAMESRFTLVQTESLALFLEYSKDTGTNKGLTYTAWLETQVLTLRSSVRGLLGEHGEEAA